MIQIVILPRSVQIMYLKMSGDIEAVAGYSNRPSGRSDERADRCL